MNLKKEDIINFISEKDYTPAKTRELYRLLDIADEDYRAFKNLLKELERDGALAKLKGGRWALPRTKGLIHGRIDIKRRGFGFLIPDDPSKSDIFIPEGQLLDAFNNDRVAVKVKQGSRGRDSRKYGTIVKILERSLKRLVCVVEEHGDNLYCIAECSHLPYEFVILENERSPSFNKDDKVLLEIKEWPRMESPGTGIIIDRLGPAGDPDTEIAAILSNYSVAMDFSEETVKEVQNISEDIAEDEVSRRNDLRDELCFTIDPDDAKDFDDAISIKRTADGIEIGVHIADVSHFVREGTSLYAEAKERSTSIYLPERVIPMIPHELSSNICSLRPDEDKLAMSVFMTFDNEMELIGAKSCRSVIRSKRRFTYREVYEIIADKKKTNDSEEVISSLQLLYTAAMKIRKKRLKAGSIELELPEYKVLLDENGEAAGMKKVEHDFSHQMVEECMLAANIAMGRYAKEGQLPVLYRVHEAPDNESLIDMAGFLSSYGYDFRLPFNRKRLNKVLKEAKGKPEEHAINLAVLMSMNQAVYSPETGEHFALAFPVYAHFTSPIRRFPDLQLHASLKDVIPGNEQFLPRKIKTGAGKTRGTGLIDLGNHTSAMERRAMKVEEAVKDLRRLELLAKTDQKLHKAVVTGIKDFGVFVEIEDFFVEGLLHRDDLQKNNRSAVEIMPQKKDNKKKKKRSRQQNAGFHLGEEVLVAVTEISMSDRKCSLEYIGPVEE
ncbi:MAG: ribonuclease R [Planctomycetota bacterium]|jgi:ribonuclease R